MHSSSFGRDLLVFDFDLVLLQHHDDNLRKEIRGSSCCFKERCCVFLGFSLFDRDRAIGTHVCKVLTCKEGLATVADDLTP